MKLDNIEEKFPVLSIPQNYKFQIPTTAFSPKKSPFFSSKIGQELEPNSHPHGSSPLQFSDLRRWSPAPMGLQYCPLVNLD